MTSALTRFLLSVLSMIVLTALTGCDSDHSESSGSAPVLPTVSVSVITAELSSPARQVEIMGTVQAAERASIAAKISGNITDILVSPGSRVKQGDLLISISAGEISAKLLQVQAQLDQATRNLTREQNLLKKNAATVEKVRTLEETRKIAEAAYKEARTMLSYTSIKAPFDGIITKKHANVGDLAIPGSPLLQLESESPRSRTAPVKLTITAESKIRSGQFARVRLPGTRGTAILLPESAIHQFGQMERVFIVNENQVQLRLVKSGLKLGNRIEILAGIEAGDQVVVSADAKLQDGQPISLQ